jgi:hypothetical protein
MSLADPMGRILTEIRDDPTVAAITTRIRGGEPAAGDALGAGHYLAFVVLSMLGRTRLPHVPVQEVRISARCYGVTFQGATALAAAVSDAIHARGHRISPSGMAIFDSLDDGAGETTTDPGTGQPYASLVISVNALTELIP